MESLTPDEIADYIYLGDRITDDEFIKQQCNAIRDKDGKCIRGRNSNMLVRFGQKIVVVLARRLRKIKP